MFYICCYKSVKIMDKILIKLESLDPTGISFKTNSFEMKLEPNDSMKTDRLFLTVGECMYRITKHGYIVDRVVPHDEGE